MSIMTLGKVLPVILPYLETAVKAIFPGRAGRAIWGQVSLELQKNAGKQIDFATKWLEQDKGEPFYKSGWRPVLMWTCITVVIQWLIVNPFLIFFLGRGLPVPDLTGIPIQVWYILLAGVGVYIPARSYDKRTKEMARYRVEVPVNDGFSNSRRVAAEIDNGHFTSTPRPHGRTERPTDAWEAEIQE